MKKETDVRFFYVGAVNRPVVGIQIIRVIPIFIIVAVGFFAGRAWKVPDDMIKHMTNMIIFIFLPCLIFVSSLTTDFSSGAWSIIIAALFIVTFIGLISYAVARYLHLKNGVQSGFMLGNMFMNAGSLGTSVALFVFGTEAFLLAVIFYITIQMLLYTVGVFIVSDSIFNLRSVRPLLSLPLVYALILGVGLSNLGMNVGQVMQPIQMLAAAAIPLLLITLGMQLSKVQLSPADLKLPTIGTMIRIPLGFTIALAFVLITGIHGLEKSVVLLSASMPTAITTFVVASRFEADTKMISQQILLTTILSLFTIPLILLAIDYV